MICTVYCTVHGIVYNVICDICIIIVSSHCAQCHCISIRLYQYATTHSITYTSKTTSILSAPIYASFPAPAPAVFLITCNILSPLYDILSTIDSALSVEAARTSKFAASAGSVKVAACASTSDSAAVQGGYACICGATLQTRSRGDRGCIVPYHGLNMSNNCR